MGGGVAQRLGLGTDGRIGRGSRGPCAFSDQKARGIGTGKPAGWLSQSVVAGAAPVLWCCQGAQAAGGGCAAGESALSARGPAGVGLPLGIQPLGDGVL